MQQIIIVGGGIVGSLAAILLADLGFEITIIEKQEPKFNVKQNTLRVSAISPTTKVLLDEIGIVELLFKNKAVAAFSKMEVYDAIASRELNFLATDYNKLELGFIVENVKLLKALRQKISNCHNINLFFGCCNKFINTESGVKLFLISNQGKEVELKGDLAIAADGAKSWLRQQSGIISKKKLYGQEAIVATVKTVKHHNFTARQVFNKGEILAFLPLAAENLCSIVWSLSSNIAKDLLNKSETDFNSRLSENKFYSDLGNIEVVGKRQAFPLFTEHANNYCSQKVLLMGDAAHVVHPMAGLGVNIGIHDVIVFRDLILKMQEKTKQFNISELGILKRYNRHARSYNLSYTFGIDMLWRIFMSSNPAVIGLRKVGLELCNSSYQLKKEFAFKAIGI